MGEGTSKIFMKKIIESYKRKLASEEGWVLKRGADLRIALCYPNTYGIGMANLGFHAMYELFNRIPEVSCERAFLPDSLRSQHVSKGSGYDQAIANGRASDPIDEMQEYERTRTPLLSKRGRIARSPFQPRALFPPAFRAQPIWQDPTFSFRP